MFCIIKFISSGIVKSLFFIEGLYLIFVFKLIIGLFCIFWLYIFCIVKILFVNIVFVIVGFVLLIMNKICGFFFCFSFVEKFEGIIRAVLIFLLLSYLLIFF